MLLLLMKKIVWTRCWKTLKSPIVFFMMFSPIDHRVKVPTSSYAFERDIIISHWEYRSDEEESDGDDNNDGDERDYSIGVGTYLKKVKAGKINLHKRLISCLSFEKITMFASQYVEKKKFTLYN